MCSNSNYSLDGTAILNSFIINLYFILHFYTTRIMCVVLIIFWQMILIILFSYIVHNIKWKWLPRNASRIMKLVLDHKKNWRRRCFAIQIAWFQYQRSTFKGKWKTATFFFQFHLPPLHADVRWFRVRHDRACTWPCRIIARRLPMIGTSDSSTNNLKWYI